MEDCNCYREHSEDCPNFDFKQGLARLKSVIESLETLMIDGFELSFCATSKEFVAVAKHPHQTETFIAHSAIELVNEIDQWVSACQEGM